MLLDVRDLRVDIPTTHGVLHAVQGIDLCVAEGETLCIVGESGCGKSLTALAIMGLLPRRATRSAARIDFDGADLATLSPGDMRKLRGDRIAMIFQEPMTSLNPVFTIGEQMVDVLRQHRRVSRAAARERAVHLLDKVGVSAAVSRLAQYPHQLSGGLRQRVMIAMALMCGPKLLLADEPTTALDVTVQAELLRLLVSLQQDFKMGMALITHDLALVSRIADRVAVMYAGEVVENGPVEAIFARPSHPYTQGLMACIPLPERARMQHLPSIPGMVPSLVGHLEGCRFRSRCAHRQEVCARDVALRPAAPEHLYRCVLPPDVARMQARAAGAIL